MSKKPTARDCSGCRDDFYNRNRMGLNETATGPRCWSLETAVFAKARDVPIDMRPPYAHLPIVKRPSCYRSRGYTRVSAEHLTKDGYWK